MNSRPHRAAQEVTVRQVSKESQELGILSRCPDCDKMIEERKITHPCRHWPFRSLE